MSSETVSTMMIFPGRKQLWLTVSHTDQEWSGNLWFSLKISCSDILEDRINLIPFCRLFIRHILRELKYIVLASENWKRIFHISLLASGDILYFTLNV